MNITDRATAGQIINALNAAGAKAPKAITDAHERTMRLSDATRALAMPDGALADAVATALEDGRDPAADPEVQRVLTASQIGNQGIMQAVDAIAFDRFREVCRDHADEIVTSLRKAFDQAAMTLTAAHTRIGDVPLEDTHTIMQKGNDIADVWAAAQAAVKVIDAASSGWTTLAQFTRLAAPDRRHIALRIAAVDPETWKAQRLTETRLTPWEVLRHGLTLELPTFAEYRERVAAIDHAEREPETRVDPERSAIAGRQIWVPVR